MPLHVKQTPRQTFKKEERLVSHKFIEQVFAKGKSISVFPFRLLWMETILKSQYPVKIAFAVSKKNFPNAVDRNKVRRRMREVYRKNKSSLYAFLNSVEKQCVCMLIYTTGKHIPFDKFEEKLQITLTQFEENFNKNNR